MEFFMFFSQCLRDSVVQKGIVNRGWLLMQEVYLNTKDTTLAPGTSAGEFTKVGKTMSELPFLDFPSCSLW